MTYIYDIEIVIDCNTFMFIDSTTPQSYIDDYIQADIDKNEDKLKQALAKIKFKEFIIYDDINQLQGLINFLRDKDTSVLVGYNSHKYDDIVLDYILHNSAILLTYTADRVINTLFELSQNIIAYQKIGTFRKDFNVPYSRVYTSIDLMRLHRLDKLRVSLKQVSISLKWYRVEDYTPPEITNAERMKFGYVGEIEWYNRYVLPEHLSGLLFYNRNDVLITLALYNHGMDELKNRIVTQNKYKVNVLSLSRSSTADMLMSHFYSTATGLDYWDFKDKRTYRRVIRFKDLISDTIKFEDRQLCLFLDNLKETVIKVGQDSFRETLVYKGTGYNFAQGGLHSVDRAGVLESNDEHTYIDADVASFYPNIIIKYGIKPKHLSSSFIDILEHITTSRLAAKHSGDKTTADILKIVINSVFGKLGFEYGFLYDLKAMYQVTINGQLNLLMLIEQLELNGFHVVSANTDGIVAKVPNNRKDEYLEICKKWEEYTKFDLEYNNYAKYVRLNVNSYLSITDTGSVKMKNDFVNKIQIDKGYFAPCIAKTLYEYYVNNNKNLESIIKTYDIYDYCISIKVGAQFKTELHSIKNNLKHVEVLQKNNRYFVSKTGGVLLKHKDDNSYTNVIKGKYVTVFNTFYESDDYNIDYSFYLSKVREMINKISGAITKDMKKSVGTLFDNIE